jgi:hypothetical protein
MLDEGPGSKDRNEKDKWLLVRIVATMAAIETVASVRLGWKRILAITLILTPNRPGRRRRTASEAQEPREEIVHTRAGGSSLEESVARYLSQLDTADRQEPSEALAVKAARQPSKLKEEMGKLAAYEKEMLASPDQQISLTDPDSRSSDKRPRLRCGWLQRAGGS